MNNILFFSTDYEILAERWMYATLKPSDLKTLYADTEKAIEVLEYQIEERKHPHFKITAIANRIIIGFNKFGDKDIEHLNKWTSSRKTNRANDLIYRLAEVLVKFEELQPVEILNQNDVNFFINLQDKKKHEFSLWEEMELDEKKSKLKNDLINENKKPLRKNPKRLIKDNKSEDYFNPSIKNKKETDRSAEYQSNEDYFFSKKNVSSNRKTFFPNECCICIIS